MWWPYGDGTVSSTVSNNLVSTITGTCYSKMNQPDHGVYTVIQPLQLMSLHLTTNSDISIVDGKTVQYFRVDVGTLLMGWATNQLDSKSTMQYDDTGRLNTSPPTLTFHKLPGKRDWPILRYSPTSGSGTCNWCMEPFIISLVLPQKCFIARPLAVDIHNGYALGFTCNVSIDKGVNCIGSSTINTHIVHLPSGTTLPLSQEPLDVNFGTNPEGFEEVQCSDEIAFFGVSGTPQFLWKHIGCPGQSGSGCYRLSVFQSHSTTSRRRTMICHLKDASCTNQVKTNWYKIQPVMSHWQRVSMVDADDLIMMATDKTVVWLNDIQPSVSAMA